MARQTLLTSPGAAGTTRRPRPSHLRPLPDDPGSAAGNGSEAARAVEAYQQGRGEALITLMRLFNPTMTGVARRYLTCSQDVEDAVQDAWLAFARSARRIQTPAAIGGWLCTTTSRSALAIAQRQARCRPSDTWAEGAVAPIDSTRIERQDETRAVREAVARLSPPERELLALLFDAEATYTTIAASTGRPVGGIGPTRQRIITKLRHDRAICRQVAARSA